MPWTARRALATCALATGLAGCATRLAQARVEHVDPSAGYRVRTELERVVCNYPDMLLLLAYSGGGAHERQPFRMAYRGLTPRCRDADRRPPFS